MLPPIHPDPKQLEAMAAYAPPVVVEQSRETHEARVERMAHERLLAKLVTVPAHHLGDAIAAAVAKPATLHTLRTAFLESPEAFGDMLQNLVRDEFALQAEIEARQIVERIEGAERASSVRTFRVVGDGC